MSNATVCDRRDSAVAGAHCATVTRQAFELAKAHLPGSSVIIGYCVDF